MNHDGRENGAERLATLLESFVREHEALLALSVEHRDAIAQANAAGLARVIEQTNAIMTRIGHLDQQRATLVAELAGDVDGPVTLTQLSEHLGGEEAERSSKLAFTLRQLAARVQREHATLRAASESLTVHMQGLMKGVAQRLSHAGTYGARGVVEAGRQQVISGIDIRR